VARGDNAAATAAEIVGQGGDAEAVGLDVTDRDALEALPGAIMARRGRLDIVISNAGITRDQLLMRMKRDDWDAVIATNLSAAFHTTRVAIGGMKARKWGRIINIASAHGLVASGEKSAYVAAKHGIVGLTKVVAIEAANDGITCNAICPGWVLTPLVAQQIETRARAAGQTFEEAKRILVAEKQPMLQYTTPENIGALAVFLAGDAAATITGSAYSIDGGWTAQ
jgi:3-hydroxybutyrate dehydrogenase